MHCFYCPIISISSLNALQSGLYPRSLPTLESHTGNFEDLHNVVNSKDVLILLMSNDFFFPYMYQKVLIQSNTLPPFFFLLFLKYIRKV